MTLLGEYPGFSYTGERRGEPLRLFEVRQRFPASGLSDIEGAVVDSMCALDLAGRVEPGARIVVTAGSRGIAAIPRILAGVCTALRELGADPVVLGAMGSHGGGTDAGQLEVLHSLGITADSVGAPVVTASETVELGRTNRGLMVHCDPLALEADGVIVVNRVKSHTTARGSIQSGIVKKLVVGLGHRPGAESFHQCGPAAMSEELEDMARIALESLPFLGGIAIVENAHEEPHRIEGIRPPELFSRERELLVLSRSLSPTLPFPGADVLVVQSVGKNYSGTGVDTGVIGRYRVQGEPDSSLPSIARICALDLSPESHGNATGIGLLDLVTRRLAAKVDPEPTYTNVLASTLTMRAMLPMVMRTDEDAVWASVASAAVPPTRDVKLAVIRNTLDLETLWVTGALLEDTEMREGMRASTESRPVTFSNDGVMEYPA